MPVQEVAIRNVDVTFRFYGDGMCKPGYGNAFPSVQITCNDGYLFTIGYNLIGSSAPFHLLKFINQIQVSDTPLNNGQFQAFSFDDTFVLHLTEYESFSYPDNSSRNFGWLEHYYRLRVPGAVNAPGWAKQGARMQTTLQLGRGSRFWSQPMTLPSFLVEMFASQCQGLHDVFGIDIHCEMTGMEFPNDTANVHDETVYPHLGPGIPVPDPIYSYASAQYITCSVDCRSFGTPGSPRRVECHTAWCPRADVRVVGDTYNWNSVYAGTNFAHDLVSRGLYALPAPNVPANNYRRETSAGTMDQSFSQQFWANDGIGMDPTIIPADRPDLVPYSLAYAENTFVDLSLQGLPQEMGVGNFIIGPAYEVWRTDRIDSAVADTGSATNWISGTGTYDGGGPPVVYVSLPTYGAMTLSQPAPGNWRAVTHATKKGKALFRPPALVDGTAWRYLDITYRSITTGGLTIQFQLPGQYRVIDNKINTIPGSGVVSSDILIWDLTTDAAAGTWKTTRIDLLKPDRVRVLWSDDGSTWYYRNVTRSRDQKQTLLNSMPYLGDGSPNPDFNGNPDLNMCPGDFSGPIPFAPGLELESNRTYEFGAMTFQTVENSGVGFVKHTAGFDRAYGMCDEKCVLQGTYHDVPIGLGPAPFTLQNIYDGLRLHPLGWTVTPPSGGFPTHLYRNMQAFPEWLGGGGGWIWDGGTWVSWLERSDAGGTSTYKAQPVWNRIRVCPGMTSPHREAGATANQTMIRFRNNVGQIAFGHVWSLGLPLQNAEVRLVPNGQLVSSFVASATTDVNGWYKMYAADRPVALSSGVPRLTSRPTYNVYLYQIPTSQLVSPEFFGTIKPYISGLPVPSIGQCSFWLDTLTPQAYGPIEAASARGFIHIASAKKIKTYHVQTWELADQSDDHPVDVWEALRHDPRYGLLACLGKLNSGPTRKVFISNDGGKTIGTEVLSVTATSAKIQQDSERGLLVIMWENGGQIQRQESKDGGLNWSTAAGVQYYDGTFHNLSGAIIDLTQDPRAEGVMAMVVTSGATTKVYTSKDAGKTWVISLS